MQINGRDVWIAVATLTIVWMFWAQAGWFLDQAGFSTTIEQRGLWGDSFGGLNALLSSLAFAAVLTTIVIQQNQLKEAQRDQHRQRFDESFFRLLGLLREVRAELRYKRTSTEKARQTTGAEALRSASLDASYYLLEKSAGLDRDLTKIEVANIYATNVHKASEAGLGPYFRLIYTILRRIDQDPVLTMSEKIAYGNLLRGQLGTPEIALLGLNGLTKASKDLSHYLTEYRMLRYLADTRVRRFIYPHYDQRAFEARND